MISDSLKSYEKAIRRELNNRAVHIRTKSIKGGFTNRPIERYHNEIRENLKARRGLGNDGSAQNFAEMQRMYHNFLRPHMGLDGMTPAEAAGIDMCLGDDGITDLVMLQNGEARPSFIADLGDRIKYVDVINDGSAIQIRPKAWMRKDRWHGIDGVLRPHGFAWVSFGDIGGSWIRT